MTTKRRDGPVASELGTGAGFYGFDTQLGHLSHRTNFSIAKTFAVSISAGRKVLNNKLGKARYVKIKSHASFLYK